MFRRAREDRAKLEQVRRLVADAEIHGATGVYASQLRKIIGGIPVIPAPLAAASERMPDPLTGCLPVTAEPQ